MTFELYTQLPKPKFLGKAIVSVHEDGKAYFLTHDTRVIAKLHRCRLDSISMDGIKLSGMEEAGLTPTGRQKFQYQEWWLVANDERKD